MNRRTALALAAVAGLATGAVAQDSISFLNLGLPGDAPNAFDLNDQVSRYVVDLVPFTTSGGVEFGIAPIHKSPDIDGGAGFFGSLISAQAISRDLLTSVPLNAQYAEWNQAGFGVGMANNTPSFINVDLAETVQQATVFAGFSGTSQTINGTVINIDPANPSRLFVTRVLAANNQSSIGVGDSFQGGVGSVDADGNAYVRADGAIGGNNIFRVRLADRMASTFNEIGPGAVASDAGSTDFLLTGFGSTLLTPNNIPASIFGGNGSFVTTAFSPSGVFYTVNGTTAFANNSSRGSLGMMPAEFSGFASPGAISLSINVREAARNVTENIRVYAMDAAGNATGSFRNYDPTNSVINDLCTGQTVNTTFAASVNHFSQTAFRGPNAQTAVQVLANGNLVTATGLGLRQETRFDQDADNYIVAFVETPAGAVTEIPVAWTGDPIGTGLLIGKRFTSNTGENGFLLPIDIAFAGVTGPSMGAPAIDAAGNVWFTSTYFFDLNDDGMFDSITERGRVGLFRAVYDPATPCYNLELVVSTGDVFTGANSNTPYQIQFISLSDSDSVSSGAFFSGNVSSAGSLGRNAGDFDPAAPETNGGVILAAEIVYDVDGDGLFEDPTGSSTNPLSVDEAYQVLLYVGALTPVDVSVPCPCDRDGDGFQTVADYFAYLTEFFTQLGGSGSADLDGDGTVTVSDFFEFLNCLPAIGASQPCP